jgi:hypothetical protein
MKFRKKNDAGILCWFVAGQGCDLDEDGKVKTCDSVVEVPDLANDLASMLRSMRCSLLRAQDLLRAHDV